MKKKLQVFVSSTFEDLKKERQAAVEAILTSGHIPAGMELFSAGDESQKEIIKRWINESDVYLLIFGGRYGSIDAVTGRSYTHWEYQYAGEINKPRFAVVITDSALDEKVRNFGASVIERENNALYQEFKKEVLSKICVMYNDERDIKLAIFQKMGEFSFRDDLIGWVSGREVPKVTGIISEHTRLLQENTSLKAENERIRKELEQVKGRTITEVQGNFDGLTFDELRKALIAIKLQVPDDTEMSKKFSEKEYSALFFLRCYSPALAGGLPFSYSTDSPEMVFVLFQLTPHLLTFNLVEKVRNSKNEILQISKKGFEFLRLEELRRQEMAKKKQVKQEQVKQESAQKDSSK